MCLFAQCNAQIAFYMIDAEANVEHCNATEWQQRVSARDDAEPGRNLGKQQRNSLRRAKESQAAKIATIFYIM